MLNILILECPFFGRVCPGDTFIEIDTAIQSTDANENSPTNRFQQLKGQNTI